MRYTDIHSDLFTLNLFCLFLFTFRDRISAPGIMIGLVLYTQRFERVHFKVSVSPKVEKPMGFSKKIRFVSVPNDTEMSVFNCQFT